MVTKLSPSPYAITAHDPRQEFAQMVGMRAARLYRQMMGEVPQGTEIIRISLDTPGRLTLVFNPYLVGGRALPANFLQRLSVNLQGRRVVQTVYKHIVYVQVAYWPDQQDTQVTVRLESVPLDLNAQKDPLDVPIGMTRTGALWLPLMKVDSALVGGARRFGKTTLLHAWIQALQHGAQAELILWDGKGGIEFSRYGNHPFTTTPADLSSALAWVQQEVLRRQQLFSGQGVTSLPQYNDLTGIQRLRPLVLILDELADLPPDAEDALITLVRRAGAYGVHPVIGIQRPDAQVMRGQLRANLVTRIALPVVSPADSRIVLNRPGADRLPKQPGRLLLDWDARMIEAQAFQVELPNAGTGNANIPLLTDLERALVQAALDVNGWFKIREITDAVKEQGVEVGRDAVNDVARRWETLGLLTTTKTDRNGRRLGRRITPALVQACRLYSGLGGQADLSDLSDFDGEKPDLGDDEQDLEPDLDDDEQD